MIDFTDFGLEVHQTAADSGFWDENNGLIFYLKQCAMIHSEVSELTDALAKGKDQKEIVLEMADIIIRICDLHAGLKRDYVIKMSLEKALREKADINKSRPRLHGKLA